MLTLVGTAFVVEDKFEYIKQIGHGAYGVVCSAYDHTSKSKVAIKKVPKAFEDLIDAKRIVREIKLLKFFFRCPSCKQLNQTSNIKRRYCCIQPFTCTSNLTIN